MKIYKVTIVALIITVACIATGSGQETPTYCNCTTTPTSVSCAWVWQSGGYYSSTKCNPEGASCAYTTTKYSCLGTQILGSCGVCKGSIQTVTATCETIEVEYNGTFVLTDCVCQ